MKAFTKKYKIKNDSNNILAQFIVFHLNILIILDIYIILDIIT